MIYRNKSTLFYCIDIALHLLRLCDDTPSEAATFSSQSCSLLVFYVYVVKNAT